MENRHGNRILFLLTIALTLSLLCGVTAWAATVKAVVSANQAVVYQKPSIFSDKLATKKGHSVSVKAVSGNWAKIANENNEGYVLKRLIRKTKANASGKVVSMTLEDAQKRLNALGYLKSGAVTGKANEGTAHALRIFQMMNGLNVNGNLNDATKARLASPKARKKPAVSIKPWKESGISHTFRTRSIATLIDLGSGLRMRIRRVGGTHHCDVEPRSASDTEVLRKMYGGEFSWDSRAVLLIAGGKCYAAAINGMPHGKEISTSNNYKGQFCLHLKGSLNHNTGKVNPAHQANVQKAWQYLNA